VTLTATVASGATAVTNGAVNFCDATATFCTDVHLLGTAQLTSAGTAAINLRPGIGSHSYLAKFLEPVYDLEAGCGEEAIKAIIVQSCVR
jgi:hypothetical protein